MASRSSSRSTTTTRRTVSCRRVDRGEQIELVVLTTDAAILALDDVYVRVRRIAGGDRPMFRGSLQAGAVRRV